MRAGRIFYLIVIFVFIFEGIRLYSVGPEQMAAHFNALGAADRFEPKYDFFATQIKIALGVIGLSVLTDVLLMFTPSSWINLPNKSYWMSPERRDIVMDRLSENMSVTFGSILIALLAGLELSIQANLRHPPVFQFQWMLLVLGVVFIFNMMMTNVLLRSFSVPPTAND